MKVKVEVLPPKHWYGHVTYKVIKKVILADTTVPVGFVSDGATIPRWLGLLGGVIILIACLLNSLILTGVGAFIVAVPTIFPRTNNYLAAALVHDYELSKDYYTRKECDGIFKDALKQLKVSPYRYYPMYLVVRVVSLLKVSR